MSFATSAPIASTSKDPIASNPAQDSTHERLLDQRDVLDRLAEGEGIAAEEWDGVVERCYVCNKFMLEAVFQGHTRDCWHVSDDSDDVPDEWGK
jgi:hypothetical protein